MILKQTSQKNSFVSSTVINQAPEIQTRSSQRVTSFNFEQPTENSNRVLLPMIPVGKDKMNRNQALAISLTELPKSRHSKSRTRQLLKTFKILPLKKTEESWFKVPSFEKLNELKLEIYRLAPE